MNNNIKNKIKRVIAIIGIIVILFLLVMMIVAMINRNGNMVLGSLISIIFVSIVFYIALNVLKKN